MRRMVTALMATAILVAYGSGEVADLPDSGSSGQAPATSSTPPSADTSTSSVPTGTSTGLGVTQAVLALIRPSDAGS